MRRPLIEQTIDDIINYIIKEDLDSGAKLPNEYKLSEQLGVGRSTLREAVRSLVSRNILEVKQGAGTYISKNKGIADDPLGFIFIKNTLKLTKDLFELRYILEPEVAMLAANNHKKNQLERLENKAKKIESSIMGTDELHLGLDIDFHSIIAKMSGNIAMVHLIPVINQSITLYNAHYTSEQSKLETIESHHEIIEAIKSRDQFRAKRAMQVHISNNQKQLELISKKKEANS